MSRMIPRAGTVARVALDDQIVELVRDLGAPLTQEIARRGPSPTWAGCGHEGCTMPDHQQRRFYDGLSNSEARLLLDRLAKQGRLVRTIEATTKGHRWSVPIEIQDTLDFAADTRGPK